MPGPSPHLDAYRAVLKRIANADRSCSACSADADTSLEWIMKDIRYRGGMLSFRIPDSWEEEEYRDGGAAYFEPGEKSGTLNLSMTTVQRNEGAVSESALREIVEVDTKAGEAPAEALENGNYLRRYERRAQEAGAELHLTFWSVSNAVLPRTVRLAVFGFAVPAQDAGNPEHVRIVHLLDAEIRAAIFTHLTPEEIQAMIKQARGPWWKFW